MSDLKNEVAAVDARSESLMREFGRHMEDAKRAGMDNERVVFEAWVLQKIAGLQLAVEALCAACSGDPEKR